MSQNTESVSKALGRQRKIRTSIILSIVTLGIANYVWTYKTFDELHKYRGQGLGGVLGVILFFFTYSLVAYFVIPAEVSRLYREDGRESPVTWKLGLWFLLPIVGSLIWFNTIQGLLNQFWGSKGAPAP